MMTPEFIDQRFYACNAAIKTLIECLVATKTVTPPSMPSPMPMGLMLQACFWPSSPIFQKIKPVLPGGVF